MAPPPVSVVIPAYNQAAYLPAAIDSALGQTVAPAEILVVDDGSTDETPRIAARYGDRVRYLHQDNQGLAAARNTGIRHARHALIGLLDADDQWLPLYLARMLIQVEADPAAAIYYCRAEAMDAGGDRLARILEPARAPTDDLLPTLLRANHVIPSTVLMNYGVIAAGECFDVAFRRLQDWELWIRLLRQGCHFRWVPEVLVRYRIHGEALSTDPVGGQQAAMALVAKHFGVDDARPESWPADKRRAYGGVYRYHALGCAKGLGNRADAAAYLARAFRADSTLAEDLDLYYELVTTWQPPGSRAAAAGSREEVGGAVEQLVREATASLPGPRPRRRALGTMYAALGLAAYNLGPRRSFRPYFRRAIRCRPALAFDRGHLARFLKSYLGAATLDRIRGVTTGRTPPRRRPPPPGSPR